MLSEQTERAPALRASMPDDSDVMDLWVKAGSDGANLGGDPVSQQLFMILLLKRENPECKFNVRTVNEAKPPADFRSAGLRHAPALQHGEDIAISQQDEIVEYVDRIRPYPSLKYSNEDADSATADLFRAFCFFIKEVNKDPKNLLNELYRLDQYLGEVSTKFLVADEPKHLDCIILPKLHAIRIAGKALKEFEIPVDLHNLWRYLEAGYQHDAFRRSCPSDQEIVLYWAERKDTPNLPMSQKSALARQRPHYTLIVPGERITANGDS